MITQALLCEQDVTFDWYMLCKNMERSWPSISLGEVKQCSEMVGRNVGWSSFASRHAALSLLREGSRVRSPRELSCCLASSQSEAQKQAHVPDCQSSTAREILDNVVPRDQEFRKSARQFDSAFADRSLTGVKPIPRACFGLQRPSDCAQCPKAVSEMIAWLLHSNEGKEAARRQAQWQAPR
jgi:hypothetical protein